ncbi:hypothetical protein PMAG_a0356 [Pseudoalteromonas mariniglutinosa NCIMB 1770]|nr:hypothetical protein [Pseudoalteromonas mariniglutinosa NCIMB 1770]
MFKHITKFDRLLSFTLHWLLIFSGLSGALLLLQNSLEVFGE